MKEPHISVFGTLKFWIEFRINYMCSNSAWHNICTIFIKIDLPKGLSDWGHIVVASWWPHIWLSFPGNTKTKCTLWLFRYFQVSHVLIVNTVPQHYASTGGLQPFSPVRRMQSSKTVSSHGYCPLGCTPPCKQLTSSGRTDWSSAAT